MSTVSLSEVVVRLVRSWVYCYTSGLPTVARDARRQEIDSDLWEHQQYGMVNGHHPVETTVEVFGRFLIGIPADLVWRWEQRTMWVGQTPASAGESKEAMAHIASQQSINQKWLLAVPAALAAFSLYQGFSLLSWDVGENTAIQVFGSLGAGIAFGFLPAALLVGGLVWSWRSPATGAAVTLGLVFLYLGVLQAWVSLQEGWINASLLSALGAGGAILYLAGLAISRRQPNIGGLLALGGAVPMALILWWSVFMPILALLLGTFALHRAKRLANEQEPLS